MRYLLGLFIASAAGLAVVALLNPTRPNPAMRGAFVVKICHGSTIYRLRDGRIVADSAHRVEDPETVCEVR